MRYNKQLTEERIHTKNSLSDNCKRKQFNFVCCWKIISTTMYYGSSSRMYLDCCLPSSLTTYGHNIFSTKRKYKLLIWNAQSYAIVFVINFHKRHLLDYLQFAASLYYCSMINHSFLIPDELTFHFQQIANQLNWLALSHPLYMFMLQHPKKMKIKENCNRNNTIERSYNKIKIINYILVPFRHHCPGGLLLFKAESGDNYAEIKH